MPDDLAHVLEQGPRRHSAIDVRAGQPPVKTTFSITELMLRNGALVRQNRQLTGILAGLTAQALPDMSCLTPRQKEVMALVLAGRSSKIIADDLNISQRTVENHRAAIMRRTGATSLPSLVRLSMGVQ